MVVYELAFSLHKFAYEVYAMPYEEFNNWQLYFDVHPIGWREDDRTLKLLQVQGFKGEPESVFTSFARMKKANRSLKDSMKGSMMFKMINTAVGGVTLEL